MNEISKRMVVSGDLERDLIFQSLFRIQAPVQLEIGGTNLTGFVEEYESQYVLLHLDSPLTADMDGNVRVTFVFHNSFHYFDSPAQRKDERHLLLVYPDKIFKNIMRRHDRRDVFNRVFMRFKVHIRSDREEFKNSSLADERLIVKEVSKPKPAIDRILSGIKNLVSEFAQNFQVKIFKDRNNTTFEEELLRQTGSVFLIYDSFEESIEEKKFAAEQVLTIADAYEFLIQHGESREATESRLVDLLQQKRNNDIYSECLVPLMLEGEVVGCIRLFNGMDNHRSIKPHNALRAAKYGAILVEALVKYDYFTLESGDGFDIPVVNIGAGGLLFKLDRLKLKQYLILQTMLQMSIHFQSRHVEASGVIQRIDDGKSEYGVQFKHINGEDARYIDDVVHNKAAL